ncbi:MAG: exodeoxyribonuclease VII large subunit [Thauera sp.]|nr:exodeoxyribonuclease VII large subunit [Thauera sp.]
MPANPFLPANGAATPAAQVVSVSELNRMARELLESALPLMWVGGEISNLVRAASGHVYFTLKDASAQVRCAMWRNRAQLLAFRPENGMRVEARALVTLYEARGDYQLSVEALRPAGIGSLFEAFNRLKAKLAAEGLFDEEGRRALPRYPRALGIVTSPQAAALRDVLVTLRRRAPHLPVVLYPAPVQGADAPVRLLEAVRSAGRRAAEDGVDVLLLVRGGGSIEDLWAFNDEALARALRACPLPVVCGVGHETDFTIADFAADLRAPTPTGAAELVCTDRAALWSELQTQADAMRQAVARQLQTQAQRLDLTALRLARPGRSVARQRQHLDTLAHALNAARARRIDHAAMALPRRADRLRHAVQRQLQDAQQRLDNLGQRLQALDPHAVLSRGYAWVESADGRPVTQAAQLTGGDAVQGVWADGRAALQVTAVSPTPAAPATPRRRAGSRGSA